MVSKLHRMIGLIVVRNCRLKSFLPLREHGDIEMQLRRWLSHQVTQCSLVFFFLFTLSCSALEKPNLLIIQTDEHHFGTLGCYGGEIVDTQTSTGCESRESYVPVSMLSHRSAHHPGLRSFQDVTLRRLRLRRIIYR